MHTSKRMFISGKRLLAHHRPGVALEYLRQSVKRCPVSQRNDLVMRLFYLGIALKKVGMPSSALKTWKTARTVAPRSYAGRMADRFINDYGMLRQPNQELDDWNAFYAIQLKKYLSSKRSRKIGSQGEKDMIWDLIYEYWQGIIHSGVLRSKGLCEKLELFASIDIIFPYFSVPDDPDENGGIITVDFHKHNRVNGSDPCPCRSGLSYSQCCGRTIAEEELLFGLF